MTGHVFGDESLFDSDRGGPLTQNRPDTPDYGGELSALVYDHGASAKGFPPPVFAARELVITMRSQGIAARLGRGRRVHHRAPGSSRLFPLPGCRCLCA